jgi:hypothetical protein
MPVLRWLLPAALVATIAAGCSSDGGGPSASVTTPPTSERTTTTLTVEQEVEAAYLRSWDVYAKAVRDLDPSGLEESYASPQLERTRAAVEKRKAANTPSRVKVEHDLRVVMLQASLAQVVDRYRNHSVLIDASTGTPVEPDPNSVITETYTLKEIDGRWMVTDIVRSSS